MYEDIQPRPEGTQKEPMGFERDNPKETQLKAHQTPDTKHQATTPDSTQQAPKIPEGARAPAQPSVEPTLDGLLPALHEGKLSCSGRGSKSMFQALSAALVLGIRCGLSG
jgi:hypothetical protein